MVILYSGEYPGASAGAKRIGLYQKGIEEAGASAKIVTTFRPSRGRFGFYLNALLQPFLVFFKVIRQDNKSNLLFVYGYNWDSLLFIRIATCIKGQKMIIEINEKPGTCYGNRLTELSIVKNLNRILLTRLALPLIDGFVVISEQLKDYLVPFQGKQAKILKVPILIDPALPHTDLTVENSPLLKPFLLHAGALSERKDGIIGVFEAFAIANQKLNHKLHFYLTDKLAPSEVKRSIENVIKENQLEDNVHFVNRLSEKELLIYQQQCSLLILNKPDNEQNRYNFPTKLGEYLRLKKPVIYTPVGEMANYLKDGINAFEVPVDRPDLLAEKIVFVIENPEQVKPIAEQGAAFAQNEFNYRVQGKRLKTFFDTF
ncbi:MAG: glycosyltransferase family 4 protein [Mariniphaga sp.]|nr:glycosyltransferase family 4 protein [Mariniphaga sp.]